MLTPREKRFAKLAIEEGLLTQDQVSALTGPASDTRREGVVLMLWDSAVLKKMMDAGAAAKLMDEVGELDVEKLGKFTIVKHLGRGGMGSVWLGLGPDNQKAAVKVLHPSFADQQTFLTRFFREAQTSVKLKHDHIVRGLEAGESGGHYYFAMEFIEGQSVESLLRKEGHLPSEKATAIILEVAEALAYAHQNGMIHRDIKPDNIMITAGGHAKLADLGLARMTEEGATRLTESGAGMGTPAYMPPEQSANARNADARSDIYALGATWFHMAVGEPPFAGSSAMELIQKHQKDPLKWPVEARGRLPKGVILTIELMMAKAPQNRIQKAEDLIIAIKSQCLGQRDVFKELGVARETAESPIWHIQVQKGDEVKSYQIREDRLKELIRQGKLTAETNVRPAVGQSKFIPLGRIKSLASLFPTAADGGKPAERPAAKSKESDAFEGMKPAPRKTVAAGAKGAYKDLVTHYDEHDRRFRRRKALRKALSVVLQVIILAVVLGAVVVALKYGLPRVMHSNTATEKAPAAKTP